MSNIVLPQSAELVNTDWIPNLDWQEVRDESEITWGLAQLYRSWGWTVFPLYQKRPIGRWKHHQQGQCGESRLWREWRRRPVVDGVGVLGGNIAVVDFDEAEAYRRWAAEYPELARRCPTVKTYWGYHVYHRPRVECWFRLPDGAGEYIGNRVHYFVGALSRHNTGILYGWVGGPPSGPEDFPLLSYEDFGLRWTPRKPKPSAPPRAPNPRPTYPPPTASSREVDEMRAVALCLPTREGERNHKLWELARRVRFAPGADPDSWFASWWDKAGEVVGTTDERVSRRDFERMLALVERPHGEGFREMATAVVNGPLPERVGPYTDTPTRKLQALAQSLQTHAGPNKPFPLSGRMAAEVCGFAGQRVASRRIRQLEPYGLRKAKGCTWSRAAEYLFVTPPETPSSNTSCETTGESQTCPVLTAVRQAGGWDRGIREMARVTGLSFRQVRAAFTRAVASGELLSTEGEGRRATVYEVPGGTAADSQPANPPAVGPSDCPAPQPEGEAPVPTVAPAPQEERVLAPVPVPVSVGRHGPNRMERLRAYTPPPPPPPPTGTPLERLLELVRSRPGGAYLIGGSEVCPFEETIADQIGTTAEKVGPLVAELVGRGLIKRTFEAPEASIPESWERYCTTEREGI